MRSDSLGKFLFLLWEKYCDTVGCGYKRCSEDGLGDDGMDAERMVPKAAGCHETAARDASLVDGRLTMNE